MKKVLFLGIQTFLRYFPLTRYLFLKNSDIFKEHLTKFLFFKNSGKTRTFSSEKVVFFRMK
jgi:hypothetical protein